MTAPARLDVFAPITKRERDPDTGHMYVYGKITGGDLDGDQQRMDTSWLKGAVPDWFKIGNIREMHQPKAVGKALELEERDDGWYIGAKIVDRDTCVKIEEEILTGFSIGIKAPRLDYTKADAPNGLVVSGRIVETSVVDRPCLPTAVMSLAKADSADELQPVESPVLVQTSGGTAAQPVTVNVHINDQGPTAARQAALDASWEASLGKAAVPDLPAIHTKAELRKAIKATGDGTDDAIRDHIIKRAAALGLEAMVPADMKPKGAEGTTADAEALAAITEKAEGVLRDVRALVPDLAKADTEGDTTEGGEAGDIASAGEAIAIIARLIISEAESLAAGNLNEAYDISTLLDAVRALRWFQLSEESEDLELAATADAAKAEEPAAAAAVEAPVVEAVVEAVVEEPVTPVVETPAEAVTPEAPASTAAAAPKEKPLTRAEAEEAVRAAVEEALKDFAPEPVEEPEPEPELVSKAQLVEMVKTAVAEAKAAQSSAQALGADLAKAQGEIDAIKHLPMPGGPALTRTTEQQAVAVKSDAVVMKAEADELFRKADALPTNSVLANGYRARAQDLLRKVAA